MFPIYAWDNATLSAHATIFPTQIRTKQYNEVIHSMQLNFKLAIYILLYHMCFSFESQQIKPNIIKLYVN